MPAEAGTRAWGRAWLLPLPAPCRGLLFGPHATVPATVYTCGLQLLACGAFTGALVRGSYSEPGDDDADIVGVARPPPSSVEGRLVGVLRPLPGSPATWTVDCRWMDHRVKFPHGAYKR